MSKDNREVEKKLIDLFLNIKNTLENDPAIIDTIWFDSVTTLHDEISFWIDDIERGKIKGEVTTDSGANANGWISVDDRLPEIGEEVIVLTFRGKVTCLSRFIPYEGSTEYYWDNRYPGTGNTHLSRAITHWQPLPKPPITIKGE